MSYIVENLHFPICFWDFPWVFHAFLGKKYIEDISIDPAAINGKVTRDRLSTKREAWLEMAALRTCAKTFSRSETNMMTLRMWLMSREENFQRFLYMEIGRIIWDMYRMMFI